MLDYTENGVSSGRVTADGEDVRVISCDDDQRFGIVGHVNSSLNGVVEADELLEWQLSDGFVMAEINATP